MSKLEEIVKTALSLPPGSPLSDADGPGALPAWDSLGHLRVLAAVQAAFGVKLEPRELIRIERLGDLREALRRRGVASEDA